MSCINLNFFTGLFMKKKPIVTVALISVLCGFSWAFAAPHESSSAAMKDSSHQQMFKQLNLTPDQQAKMKALRQEMQELRKANREKMQALRDKSKEELLKATPNKTVLYGYAKEMGDLHKAMAESMADHMLKMKAVLTKEQFEKMMSKDFLKGMRERRMHNDPPHGGPHGMGGPGGLHDLDEYWAES
jgi:Spy/CpxP family protein refolding chaperone